MLGLNPRDSIFLIAITLSLISMLLALYMVRKMRENIRHIRALERMFKDIVETIEDGRILRILRKKNRLRGRRRYIVFQIALGVFNPEEIADVIEEHMHKLYGDKGLAESKLKLIEYNTKLGRGIIRVSYEYRYKALIALGMIRRVKGKKTIIIPLRITGSLNRAKKTMFSKTV